ncbi:hypothetical protein ACHAWO_010753 [Cyclotella atomus]|uniref:Uncharacterized protein n=1 Tax=Cyclotella atomus TaxID=382360 RepID=A0ABD3NRY4_9STRA
MNMLKMLFALFVVAITSSHHGVHGLSPMMVQQRMPSRLFEREQGQLPTQAKHKQCYNLPIKRRSFVALMTTTLSSISLAPKSSSAIPFFESNHRQLELCLVTILRTQFWAFNTAKSLQSKLLSTSPSEDALAENVRKLPYLEARLGAKALLTQKIGGGATNTVLKLASFNIKECLEDGMYWCNQLSKSNQLLDKRICTNDLMTISDDIVESLASIVEFDGLETTIDPSPRSSLMLSMYNPQKGTFVYRTLTERVIPNCERYLEIFGEEKRILCLEFIRRDYSDEIPFEILMDLYGED